MIICGVAPLAACPELTLIRAGAAVWFANEAIPGAMFVVDRRGEAGIGFRIDSDAVPSWSLGQQLVCSISSLVARAEVTDANGLSIVDGIVVWPGHGERSAWIEGCDDEQSPAMHWVGYFALGRINALCGNRLPVPQTARPRGAGTVQFELSGEIGERHAELPQRIAQARDQDLLLAIDSPGGTVTPGLAIYRALAAHPRRVVAEITGRAASMAGIIALAADQRLIEPHGRVLLHEPHVSADNLSRSALRRAAATLDQTAEQLAAIVALRTNCGRTQARQWLAESAEFGAGAAISAGLCHGLLRDYAPPFPRARQATFTAIGSPYAGVRSSIAPPPVWAVGAEYPRGQRVRHRGRIFVAVRDTWGGVGLEPGHYHDWLGIG